jgi:ribonucleoside-diphosphate reductase alpha chain
MAKEGSTVSGLMDSFATTVSVALQYGVPLRDLVNKFAHVRFEPSGFTGNSEIPIAKSTIDYIFRWLGSRFLSPDDRAMLGLIDRSALAADEDSSSPPALGGGSAPAVLSSPAGQPAAALAPQAEEGPSAIDEALELPKAFDADITQATAVAASPEAGDELTVLAKNGHANGHAPANGNGKGSNGGGGGAITLSLGSTNVAFKIQEDAPSCADCGSIMVRNGSCYKCLNCGSTSGCS